MIQGVTVDEDDGPPSAFIDRDYPFGPDRRHYDSTELGVPRFVVGGCGEAEAAIPCSS